MYNAASDPLRIRYQKGIEPPNTIPQLPDTLVNWTKALNDCGVLIVICFISQSGSVHKPSPWHSNTHDCDTVYIQCSKSNEWAYIYSSHCCVQLISIQMFQCSICEFSLFFLLFCPNRESWAEGELDRKKTCSHAHTQPTQWKTQIFVGSRKTLSPKFVGLKWRETYSSRLSQLPRHQCSLQASAAPQSKGREHQILSLQFHGGSVVANKAALLSWHFRCTASSIWWVYFLHSYSGWIYCIHEHVRAYREHLQKRGQYKCSLSASRSHLSVTPRYKAPGVCLSLAKSSQEQSKNMWFSENSPQSRCLFSFTEKKNMPLVLI